METLPYRAYGAWLRERYGQKVYKLPVALPLGCPNRDGHRGYGGCLYCGAKGGGLETRDSTESVQEQLTKNRDYIARRYKAQAFIPFFQSFSNTYCDDDYFFRVAVEAVEAVDGVVGLAVSTRPDCLNAAKLDFLADLQKSRGLDVTLELGLQSANDETLKIINRGHNVAEFVDGAAMVKERGLSLCTHLILDLPWDSDGDVTKAAALVSAAGSDFVKCHALYVERDTGLAELYARGEVSLLDDEDYKRRAILFLTRLAPDIVIQRIIGRIPANDAVIANWHRSWWAVRDEMVAEMRAAGLYQGCAYPGAQGPQA